MEGGFEIRKRRESRTRQSSFARNYSDELVGEKGWAGWGGCRAHYRHAVVHGEGRVAFPSVMELR